MPNPAPLKNLAAVLAHLVAEGRKIGQSKLYNDVGRGLLRRQQDGSFAHKDVKAYAARLPMVAMPEKEAAVVHEYAERKAKAEAEKLEAQAEAERFRNQVRVGMYVKRNDVEVELAVRAGVLATGLRTMFETSLLDFIHLVNGDPRSAQTLLAAFEQRLDAAVNEYARPMEYEAELIDDADHTEDDTYDAADAGA